MDLIRDCLGFRLSSAYRRVDRLFNRAFRRLGISHAHGQVLMCLLQDGPLRAKDVAERTGFDRSTVSRLVKELARRKLVRRTRDPGDGRARTLEPAKRGAALRAEIADIQRRLNADLCRDLPQADLDAFQHVIEVMDRLP